MKVLVTGGRDWTNQYLIESALIEARATIVVHGAAKGADLLASRACLILNLKERPYPAQWDKYGRSAGPNRNWEMLQKEHTPEEPIDLVLAFPTASSRGTWHMVSAAQSEHIPVRIIQEPNADPEAV